RPAIAFGRLGPLVRRFPHSQTVRYHLGLLSVWLGRFADARREFVLATRLAPGAQPAKDAQELAKRVGRVRAGLGKDGPVGLWRSLVADATLAARGTAAKRINSGAHATRKRGHGVGISGSQATRRRVEDLLDTDEAKSLFEAGRENGSLTAEEIA